MGQVRGKKRKKNETKWNQIWQLIELNVECCLWPRPASEQASRRSRKSINSHSEISGDELKMKVITYESMRPHISRGMLENSNPQI